MSITREQFLSIIFIARHVAKTDGKLDQPEVDALKAMLKALQVSQDELQQIQQKISLSHALEGLKSKESKQLLVDVLVFTACADGELCEVEQQFIKKIMKHLSIDPDTHPYFKDQVVDASFIKSKVNEMLQRLQQSVT